MVYDTEPVGVREIAARLNVQQDTVTQWRARSRQGLFKVSFPEPRWIVSGSDAWDWREVEEWARQTGRLRVAAA